MEGGRAPPFFSQHPNVFGRWEKKIDNYFFKSSMEVNSYDCS